MIDKELIAASSTPIILSLLSEVDSYGYEIIQRVGELTSSELAWTEAMLYPVLHRLEDRSLLKSYWRESQGGRQRKYYSLTKAGRLALADKKRQWNIVSNALNQLWRA